jgi:hypothetical protein
VKAVSTNDVTLEGINTTSTTTYPAGSGTGSVRKITGWTQLSRSWSPAPTAASSSSWSTSSWKRRAGRIPTFKNAAGLTFSIADDPTLAGYIWPPRRTTTACSARCASRCPAGAKIFYNAYISLNKTPSLNVNQMMACQVTLSLLAEPVRYAT